MNISLVVPLLTTRRRTSLRVALIQFLKNFSLPDLQLLLLSSAPPAYCHATPLCKFASNEKIFAAPVPVKLFQTVKEKDKSFRM